MDTPNIKNHLVMLRKFSHHSNKIDSKSQAISNSNIINKTQTNMECTPKHASIEM